MPTTKLGLPTITGNQNADVVRDLNALATEIDAKAGVADGLARLSPSGTVLNADGSEAGAKVAAGINVTDTGGYFTGANVEDVLQELGLNTATHEVYDATLTSKGHVQLSSSVTSSVETLAATPKAVKTAMDRADSAFTLASNGKIQVRNAITGKGGVVSDADADGYPTFQELTDGVMGLGGGLKKVQRGAFIPGTLSTRNIAITSVDLSKSVVRLFPRYANGYAGYHTFTGVLSSSSNIQMVRQFTTNNQNEVIWEVLEFENVKSLQRGTASPVGNELTVPITAVDTGKSVLFFTFRSNDAQNLDSGILNVIGKVLDSNNIHFYRGSINGTTTINYELIEFK